jgi:hypothetical protein
LTLGIRIRIRNFENESDYYRNTATHGALFVVVFSSLESAFFVIRVTHFPGSPRYGEGRPHLVPGRYAIALAE